MLKMVKQKLLLTQMLMKNAKGDPNTKSIKGCFN